MTPSALVLASVTTKFSSVIFSSFNRAPPPRMCLRASLLLEASPAKFRMLFADIPCSRSDSAMVTVGNPSALCLFSKVSADVFAAANTSAETFEKRQSAEGLPTVTIAESDLEQGISANNILNFAGLASSNSEARRHIRGGGARLNDEKITDENFVVTLANTNADGVIKLSLGKKRHVLVRVG